MFNNQKLILFIATGFFSGKAPFAPGTFGTLAALPFALVFLILPSYLHAVYVISLILAAIFFADKAQKITNKNETDCKELSCKDPDCKDPDCKDPDCKDPDCKEPYCKDPGCIVIDEIAGYVVALSIVPVSIYTLVAGFFIFRFFDIIKLPPVKYFEDNFSGGAGIVLDDIMAGIFTAIILRIIYYL